MLQKKLLGQNCHLESQFLQKLHILVRDYEKSEHNLKKFGSIFKFFEIVVISILTIVPFLSVVLLQSWTSFVLIT